MPTKDVTVLRKGNLRLENKGKMTHLHVCTIVNSMGDRRRETVTLRRLKHRVDVRKDLWSLCLQRT